MRAEELHNALGETVRDLRTSAGYSQETFAYAVGMHRTYVGSIERGERDVGLRNLAKIAEALGMTPSRLIARAEERIARGETEGGPRSRSGVPTGRETSERNDRRQG